MMGVPGTFLIGCGAGFSGDRVDAPLSVVDTIARSGQSRAIMFEMLAERTLALGHVARRADATKGYEPLLAERLYCMDRAGGVAGQIYVGGPLVH